MCSQHGKETKEGKSWQRGVEDGGSEPCALELECLRFQEKEAGQSPWRDWQVSSAPKAEERCSGLLWGWGRFSGNNADKNPEPMIFLWIGIEFSRGGHLISFTQEVSVTNKDLTKLIRLNSNYRVSSLFNYMLNWCFLINFLIKMYSTKKTCKQALTGSQRRRDAAAGRAGQWAPRPLRLCPTFPGRGRGRWEGEGREGGVLPARILRDTTAVITQSLPFPKRGLLSGWERRLGKWHLPVGPLQKPTSHPPSPSPPP